MLSVKQGQEMSDFSSVQIFYCWAPFHYDFLKVPFLQFLGNALSWMPSACSECTGIMYEALLSSLLLNAS
jgi:hypothetical protein